MFRATLHLPPGTLVFSKGMDPERDDYSALHARSEAGTPLPKFLAYEGVKKIYICGLATDYCVRQTALEGLSQAFAITILVDAVRGVDLEPGDSERALAEIQAAGARLTTLDDLRRSA